MFGWKNTRSTANQNDTNDSFTTLFPIHISIRYGILLAPLFLSISLSIALVDNPQGLRFTIKFILEIDFVTIQPVSSEYDGKLTQRVIRLHSINGQIRSNERLMYEENTQQQQ